MNLKYEVGQSVAIEVPKTVVETKTTTEIISAEIKSITICASGAKYLTSKGAFTEEQLDSYAQPAQEEPAFDWDAFKSGKIAVHCDTEEKAKAFCKEVKKRFPHECRSWGRDETNWDNYKEKTLYGISGGFVYGTEFGFGRCTIVGYPFTAEPAQPKAEPIKLYCVKEYKSGEWLTKGNTYTLKDGLIVYDDGYRDNEKGALGKLEVIPNYLIPLVSRPAKVGEWVYVTHTDYSVDLKVGDIAKVKRVNEAESVFISKSDGNYPNGLNFGRREYLVLDGYKPEPEAEPEPEYYNGKVVCVDDGGFTEYWTVGKVYEVVDSKIKYNDGYISSGMIFSFDDFKQFAAKFIEFKGE